MDSEARHPDTPRLRVVDLRIGSERRQLHFGGGFACVLARTDARSAAARWIATSIVGPPPAGSEGSETDAEEPVWRLQSPLLPLRAPAVLDRDLLQTLWRSDCERGLEGLAATRESLISEREGILAALERLQTQPPLTPAAATSGNISGTPMRSAAAEAELAVFKAAAQRFVRVQSLLATIDALVPVTPPAAIELADEWEAHLAIPPGAFPSGELEELEEAAVPAVPEAPFPQWTPPARTSKRATGAPASSASESDRANDAQRAEIERLHRIVVKAEARVFGRGLMPRARAVAKYNEARLREQAALAGAGVDTYAEFLLSFHSRPNDARDDSRDALRESIAAPSEAPEVAESDPQPAHDDEHAARAARTQELRDRARALLGHEPGDDVGPELRAHRAFPPARAECVAELDALLREEGLADVDDVVGRARVLIATPPSVHIPQPPTWAMRVTRSDVALGEIERLELELAAKDEQVEQLDVETSRLVVNRDSDLLRLGPDDFVRVVDAMIDAYRTGEVLEGHLPLVLDGVLDGLAADARDAAALALARVDDVQVIVVTDEDTVTKRVAAAGGTIVRWPGPAEKRRGASSGRRSPRASDTHS